MFKVTTVKYENNTVSITVEQTAPGEFFISLWARDKAANVHPIAYSLALSTRTLSFPINQDTLQHINNTLFLTPRSLLPPYDVIVDTPITVVVPTPQTKVARPFIPLHLSPPPTPTHSIHRNLLDIAFTCIESITQIEAVHMAIQPPYTDRAYDPHKPALIKAASKISDHIITSSINVAINFDRPDSIYTRKPSRFQGHPIMPRDIIRSPSDGAIHALLVTIVTTYMQWYTDIIQLIRLTTPGAFNDSVYLNMRDRVTPLTATAAPHTHHTRLISATSELFSLLVRRP